METKPFIMNGPIKNYSSILVANRGEIAVRIIRTAKKIGLRTVAVCTDADMDSLHVREADQIINIGEGSVSNSYLSIEKIL